MDKLIIEGGRKLAGQVKISGSKNAGLPILIATLLTDGACELSNIPGVRDIDTALLLLESLGKKVSRRGSTVTVGSSRTDRPSFSAPYDLVRKMRASFLVAGPLLARHGKVDVSLPGGCAIGVRPVDIHLEGLKRLGAETELMKGYVRIKCRKLTGSGIRLSYPSVGATENLIMAAALASGDTVISGAAKEPEITDLAVFLNSLGAKVSGAGTGTVKISGVSSLGSARHEVIPDRIETGTYMIAGAVTRGDITLDSCRPGHLRALTAKLRQAGVRVEEGADSVRVSLAGKLKPVDMRTSPYPGFPTDMQAQWMTLMCTASGGSVVREEVFENRFLHVPELQRLGAGLRVAGNRAAVSGGARFSGAPVMVSDLRAGAALVLAGLVAGGTTVVNRVYHLDRGYEKIEVKLGKLGARIRRKHG